MAEKETQWTVMAYLAGDNDLAEEMVLALQQIKSRSKDDQHSKEAAAALEKVKKELPSSAESVGGESHQDRLQRGIDSLQVALWPEMKFAAQLDPTALGIPTLRYLFKDEPPNSPRPFADTDNLLLDSYFVEGPHSENGFNEVNTGNPAALTDFIRWVVADPKVRRVRGKRETLGDCQAKHYAIVLSGHGSGATEEVFLTDENPEDALSILELEVALANARHLIYATEGRSYSPSAKTLKTELDKRLDKADVYVPWKKFHLLGLDACFMNMAEVCYQIKDHVELVVGAEGFEPEFGWPYDRIIKRAGEIGPENLDPKKLAETIVEEYVGYYSDFEKTAGRSVDLAAIQTEPLSGLVEPLKRLASALGRALDYPALRKQVVFAHWEAQSYKFEQYSDLVDLCECLAEHFRAKDLPDIVEVKEVWVKGKKENEVKGRHKVQHLKDRVVDACREVVKAVRDCVLVSRCSGYWYQHSHGLSIYFPWAVVSDDYRHLDLVKRTGWGAFLADYVKKTRRQGRAGFKQASNVTYRKISADQCAAACLDHQHDAGHKFNRRIGKYNRRIGKYGRRIGKYNRRIGKYNRRIGKYAGDRDKYVKNFPMLYGHAEWPGERDV